MGKRVLRQIMKFPAQQVYCAIALSRIRGSSQAKTHGYNKYDILCILGWTLGNYLAEIHGCSSNSHKTPMQ